MSIEILNWDWEDKISNSNLEITENKEDFSNQIVSILESIEKKYDFISISDEIFIDFSILTSRNQFISFIDSLFSDNFYLEWLDYDLFSKIMFDFSSLEKQKFKLSTSIKKIKESRLKKYSKPIIYDWLQAEYTFSKIFDQIEEDWKIKEIEEVLDIDEFIAMMWNYGIKYWLKVKEISEIISWKKSQKIVIANHTPPTPGKDAYLKSLKYFWIDLSLLGIENMDFKNYKRVFVEFPANTKLYEKVDLVEWDNGMNILWLSIPPDKIPKDIDLQKLLWEWVSLKIEDWKTFIESRVSWFITPPQWVYNSKNTKEKDWKFLDVSIEDIFNPIKITSYIDFWEVWPKTWNIQTEHNISITWLNSWYFVRAWEIKSFWEISWNLVWNWDIIIEKNVIWKSEMQENIFSWIDDGQIRSKNWNITIKWKVLFHSVISALNWDININIAQTSIIFWKNIEIFSARSCFIFWENIKITWELIDCIIISSWTVEINNMKTKSKENNLFFVKKEDYKSKIQEISNLLEETSSELLEMQSLTEKLLNENSILSKDSRSKIIIPILKKIKDKIQLTVEEKDFYLKNNSWFLESFQVYQNNKKIIEEFNKKTTQLIKKIDLLKEEFKKFSNLLESLKNQPNNSLKIKTNQSQWYLWYINIPWFTTFGDLTIEHLIKLNASKNMANYSSLLDIEKLFEIEKIQDLSIWSIDFVEW